MRNQTPMLYVSTLILLTICSYLLIPAPAVHSAPTTFAHQSAPETTPIPWTPTATPQCEPEETYRELEIYGLEYVYDSEDYPTVTSLGVDTILLTFPASATAATWLQTLDQAAASNLKVVASYWPQGWQWDNDANQWIISPEAELFLQTVENHPALVAVYGLHEPYWNGCFDCAISTAQQQALYTQIRSIADVKIWSDFSSFSWAETYYEDEAYQFADGVCDYCSTWYYPKNFNGYDRATLNENLQSELSTFRANSTNAQFIWALQAFESAEADRALPTYAEMIDLASVALQSDVDGVMWYVWNFDPSEYQEVLSDHPDLWPALREIYDDYIAAPIAQLCTPTPIPTPTPTSSPTPTLSPTPSPTLAPTLAPTPTLSPTLAPTPTSPPTPSPTLIPTPTSSSTPTLSSSPISPAATTAAPTSTQTSTPTATQTSTPRHTSTPTSTTSATSSMPQPTSNIATSTPASTATNTPFGTPQTPPNGSETPESSRYKSMLPIIQ